MVLLSASPLFLSMHCPEKAVAVASHTTLRFFSSTNGHIRHKSNQNQFKRPLLVSSCRSGSLFTFRSANYDFHATSFFSTTSSSVDSSSKTPQVEVEGAEIKNLQADLFEAEPDVSHVFAQGICYFSETGMATFRLSPAVFKKDSSGRFIADNNGAVRCLFYPRGEGSKFDTKSGKSFRIRAIDVGSILEIDTTNIPEKARISSGFGGLFVSSSGGGNLLLEGYSGRYQDDAPTVKVEITTGQFRTLQSVLTSTLPSLFGWQVHFDPRLVNNFMAPPPRVYTPREESNPFQAASNFFS